MGLKGLPFEINENEVKEVLLNIPDINVDNIVKVKNNKNSISNMEQFHYRCLFS